MYLTILLLSLVFALISYINLKWDTFFFKIEIFFLTCFLCLRYGQGTDYFNYERMYEQNMTGIDVSWLLNNRVHGEIGYKILEGIAKWFGLPFVAFFGIMSFVMMVWTSKGIKKYSNYKTLSVALLIPTFYFSYYIGIFREGFVLAAVLGVLIELYIDKRYKRYLFGVILLCGIHKYAFILVLPLFVRIFKLIKSRSLQVFFAVVGSAMLGGILWALNIKAGYISFSPSYGAIIIRIILFCIITYLYRFSNPNDKVIGSLYEFYFTGFVLYIATCPMAFISHRISAYMKISEVVLLPRLIKYSGILSKGYLFSSIRKWKNGAVVLLLLMLCVEGIKNIDSYIGQGEYYEFVHFYNFPYVTVFNQSDIYNYRYDDALTIINKE